MPSNFPESDWKLLSHLKPLAIDRLCQRILSKAGGIINRAQAGEHHQVYLDLFKHIEDNDKRVSDCFDHWSRSHALDLLIQWKYEKLLTEEEFAAFSAGTRDMVEGFLKHT